MQFCILTCTYNAAGELPRTIDSVRQQTYPHVLHYIIDGLSSDGTAALADAYARDNAATDSPHRVKVKSEKDNGLYDAMNKAIRMAAGDYIVFLNAGDTFPNEHTLSNIAKTLERYADDTLPAVVYGNTDIVDNNGRFLRHRRLQPPERLTWRSFLKGMLVCHQAFYARTDIAKNTPYDLQYRFSADVDWCIRIMKAAEQKGLPLHNTHLTLCHYLDGGMTVKNHRASLLERFHIMRRHYGLLHTILVHLWFLIRK